MRTILSLISVLALCLLIVSCSEPPLTDEIKLASGQAYYYFKVSKVIDGTGEFNIISYAWGLPGHSVSTNTRKGLIGDEMELVYVVDLDKPKTAAELSLESREAIENLRKIADFSLKIQTWDGR